MVLATSDLLIPPGFEPAVLECMVRVKRRLGASGIDAELRLKFSAYWDAIEAAHEARRRAGRGAGDVPAWSSTVAGLFLMVASSEGVEFDADLLDAAAGCELYVLSATLFDAVEDDELEGPMGDLPVPIIINAALILFVLACDAIFQLGDRLSPELQRRLRGSFVRRSLTLGLGQHRDLRGVHWEQLDAAVGQAQDKTEAIAMAAELAALAAGCAPARAEAYAEIGRRSALIRQCGNDLADLYGKSQSRDLAAGKWTLPLVAHWASADTAGRAHMLHLRADLPGSLEAIRRAVFEAGAVKQIALVMERARREIHEAIDELGGRGRPIAVVAAHADSLAARLYSRMEAC